MKLNKVSKKKLTLNIFITLAYLLLIGLLIYNVFELPDKYNKEELKMIIEVETEIRKALDSGSDEKMKKIISDARDNYVFDVVITRENDIVYKTVPYEIGDSLLNRGHINSIARESQGDFENAKGEDLFVWYSIYKLNDSTYIEAFLKTLMIIVTLVTILLVFTFYIMSKTLFDPLKKIKESIEQASDYKFNEIETSDDVINKSFKNFVSNLETNISAVSRQHTDLEKQLQAKREHLNNLLVMSRSMVHNLKSPVHRIIIENEMIAEEKYDNKDLVELALMNQELNQNVMLEINRILKMLKDDADYNEIKVGKIEIIDTFMHSINMFNNNMNKKRQQLDFEVSGDIYLITEESTFILLINNLLSNMVLYANENSELKIAIEQDDKHTTMTFINESTPENIERMKDTEQLFNAVKGPDDEYIYRSGNGLYLIKELTKILDGRYSLNTEGNKVVIQVVLDNEKK